MPVPRSSVARSRLGEEEEDADKDGDDDQHEEERSVMEEVEREDRHGEETALEHQQLESLAASAGRGGNEADHQLSEHEDEHLAPEVSQEQENRRSTHAANGQHRRPITCTESYSK